MPQLSRLEEDGGNAPRGLEPAASAAAAGAMRAQERSPSPRCAVAACAAGRPAPGAIANLKAALSLVQQRCCRGQTPVVKATAGAWHLT